MKPVDLMRCETGDFFRGDPDSEKWRGEAVTWFRALPRAEFDVAMAYANAGSEVEDVLVAANLDDETKTQAEVVRDALASRDARIARMEAALREIAGRGPKNDPCADEYGADGKRRDQFGGEASWCTFTSDESQEESAHASDVEAYAAAKIARATLDEGSKT